MIDQNYLINILIENPTNDKEIGHNNAVISILKKTISPASTKEINYHETLKYTITTRCGFDPDHYKILASEVNNIVYLLDTNQKLMAVKRVKDLTDLLLKDAKYIVDEFDTNIKSERELLSKH